MMNYYSAIKSQYQYYSQFTEDEIKHKELNAFFKKLVYAFMTWKRETENL